LGGGCLLKTAERLFLTRVFGSFLPMKKEQSLIKPKVLKVSPKQNYY
jgi:hypothetical protein